MKIVASYISKAYAIINANNHYDGSAPRTIEKIAAILDALPGER